MDNPELKAQLEALDMELEEGDITQKGYQKRRTLLLQHYRLSDYSSPNGRDSLSGSPVERADADSSRRNGSVTSGAGTVSSASPWSYGGGVSMDLHAEADDMDVGYTQPRLQVRNDTSSYLIDEPTSLESPIIHTHNDSGASGAISQTVPGSVDEPIFIPHHEQGAGIPVKAESRSNTMYDSGAYFQDFTAQAYEPRESLQSQYRPEPDNYSQQMANRYSGADSMGFSPTAAMAPPMLSSSDLPPPEAVNHLLPLEPRDVPFPIYDPHNENVEMSKFDNIASVLRHRARSNPKHQAYTVLDNKGKEMAACSWEKLAARAEKVAQVIREKSNLYRGDRVALVYRDVEVIEFAVALLGCFIAGVVAVPINNPEDYQKLNLILTTTQAHLALTTDGNLKAFQRELTTQKLSWPRGVEWWKTNEFGSFHPKKKEDVPPLQVPDLAYIEFSRAPTGDLRGVVLSHRTIMHQMATLSAIVSTVPTTDSKDTFNASLRNKEGRPIAGRRASGDVLVTFLDPRQGIGMIAAVLLAVYGGQTTVWCGQSTATTPGLYANIITRYKATLCLGDYPALKLIAYNYQTEPMITRNYQKKYPVDFSSIRLMLIDALTVDPEFHEILADRWLKPLGNTRAREVVAPMLCLPEHGGMVIAMRDWLGGEELMGCPLGLADGEMGQDDIPESPTDRRASTLNGAYSSLLSGPKDMEESRHSKSAQILEVLVDKEALKTNDVVVLAVGEEAQRRTNESGTIRLGAFGYPIPDATLAVVDPETSLLCPNHVVGEIWVDSPSLSGGFWALPKQTESIFHARPYRFLEGNPNPAAMDAEFLRTGLLGCVFEGKVFVLGLYEDRLRQRVEWVDGEEEQGEEYRYFFVQHLVLTMMRKMSKVFDCSAFDVYVNEEHLPIILLESPAASTAPTNPGGASKQLDIALLESLSERCMEVLLTEHHLRVYCVMITATNTLPRILRNGRREIGNMLCRKEFDAGTLPCVHVKFGVERAVNNLPIGIDAVGGVWSLLATQHRQDLLIMQEKQYSGCDYREVVIDDRTSTPLNNFSSIVDLLQWRVVRQAEELSYCTIDNRGREGKGIMWKKLDQKIAAVVTHMKNKWKLSAGDHAVLIYTHSEDFVYACHACFCLGVIAIPLAPLDQNRLNEDIPALLHIISDFNVKAILVNTEVDHLLKTKPLAPHLKQSANVLSTKIPPIHNTTKPGKSSQGCRDLGYTVNPAWVQPNFVALVWVYWTPDQRRITVGLGHDTIMGICKVMKETCQMTSSRPVVGCVRSTSGIGFVVSWLMGIFVGKSRTISSKCGGPIPKAPLALYGELPVVQVLRVIVIIPNPNINVAPPSIM